MNLKLLEETLESEQRLSEEILNRIIRLKEVKLNESDNTGILVNREWQHDFCAALVDMGFDYYGDYGHGDWGFENDTFIMRPYYWGDNEYISELPNFEHKTTGFKLGWYKYPLRASYMNKNIDEQQLFWILEDCKKSMQ